MVIDKKFSWLLTEQDGKYAGNLEHGVSPAVRRYVTLNLKLMKWKICLYQTNSYRGEDKYKTTKQGFLRVPLFFSFDYIGSLVIQPKVLFIYKLVKSVLFEFKSERSFFSTELSLCLLLQRSFK